AARILQDLGFTNVLLLKGGKEAWQDAGLPLEGQETEAGAS
ncbi:sulfurtransferase, partial [candidate division KSB1 bacterium]|nr:sulfurtransferase [candidate division KSB1 bacterium]NIR70289.1 sulfurtransferase [candidate division KSB1 bacterium]NIS24450.1 sulfurtransferase [candidate division KSB1 bacterium]NIT71385.1 sulfurtransferase [candidate division KSB1 bacterium]NIU25070.1 sulfurtransferase [candidate division KSB1 bacterium]